MKWWQDMIWTCVDMSYTGRHWQSCSSSNTVMKPHILTSQNWEFNSTALQTHSIHFWDHCECSSSSVEHSFPLLCKWADCWENTHPVHYQYLADVQSLLEEFGCDGHRVEITESPVIAKRENVQKKKNNRQERWISKGAEREQESSVVWRV